MIQVRKSQDRGHFDHGWLKTYHTFSFSEYHDPRHTHFRHLRVINEDFVAPADGFDTHPHQDMEILTYILEGSLEHKDSMGNGGIIKPGDIQRMSAGTGVLHSEFNPSKNEAVHLLQIWIFPEKKGVAPGYEQKNFSVDSRKNTLKLVASRDGGDGAVTINQDAKLYASILDPGKQVQFENRADRGAWIQVARGELDVNGTTLNAGDGASVSGAEKISIQARKPAEFLLFDLA